MDSRWSAEIVNDPNNDYELVIDIYYNESCHCAQIKRVKEGTIIKWFSSEEDLEMPLEWLQNLISEAKKIYCKC